MRAIIHSTYGSADLLELGDIDRPEIIDRTYPLSDAPQAIGYVEDGQARGKVDVHMADSGPR